jgi:type IV secretion system protein VirD4
MSQARLVWAAFRNMLRAAARDPLWAIIAIITAPFRLWQPVVGVLILILLMLLGLGFAGEVILSWLGFPLGSLPHSLFYFLLSLLVLWMVVRSITNPRLRISGTWTATPTDRPASPPTRKWPR